MRTGEIYLYDSPYHAASANVNEGKMQSATAIIHGPKSHISLLNVLRDEACVKLNKMVFYRTWDFGNNFHVNPEYYLKVTDAIDPHPNLVFPSNIKPLGFSADDSIQSDLWASANTGRLLRRSAKWNITAKARIRITWATESSMDGKNTRR